MECLSLFPGPETPQLCQLIHRLSDTAIWPEMQALWLIILANIFALFFALRSKRQAPKTQQQLNQTAKDRAELLLRESVTPKQYQQLLTFGYLEIPSQLYPTRAYRIPRERRRVQVYERQETSSGPQHQKLGELCVIACEPMPDADLVLTHKWLIEADEQKYLNTANWIKLG